MNAFTVPESFSTYSFGAILKPPELCVLECSAVIDEVTGVEQSAAKINVEMKNETVEK